MRALADRHGRRLERIDVAVRFGAEGRTVKNIGLTGDREPDQHRRLLAAAGRCPVHHMLMGKVAIVTVPTPPAEPDTSGA
ncbi:hypothetical protein [Streptomyces sp. AC627_RSS907]|uniref:hypothetical protein n=1 Tax=Streptomyces sp. AC627_RSS907 TaxID=2823684 RepID=UPI0027E4860E|nr:hypothetical protein [Streptomyces sp. AC627_RSS907]